MSEFRIIGVFGISGVGKSNLIAEARKDVPYSLHLQARALIKESLGDPKTTSESLRCRPSDQVRSNQDVLVESFWHTVRLQPKPLVIFDGHLVIDTDSELVEIPQEVIARLRPFTRLILSDGARPAKGPLCWVLPGRTALLRRVVASSPRIAPG
jgi:adenylate kinase